MNTPNIVAGLGFVLAYASLVLMESWEKSGALLQGAAAPSTGIALVTLVAGMVCIVSGIALAQVKK